MLEKTPLKGLGWLYLFERKKEHQQFRKVFMVGSLIDTKDIVKVFSEAVKEKNIELISSLLSTDGEFQIQQADLNTVDSDKITFTEWFSDKLNSTVIQSITFDNCLLCKIGNPVILFNDGLFPATPKSSSDFSKKGLMLEVKDEKIICIKFCHFFAQTENNCKFESDAKKIKEYMREGLTFDEAYAKVFPIEKFD